MSGSSRNFDVMTSTSNNYYNIKAKNSLIFLFSFGGRRSRLSYFYVSIVIPCVLFTMFYSFVFEEKLRVIFDNYTIMFFIFIVFGCWINIANNIKRLHDLNLSGWWLVKFIIAAALLRVFTSISLNLNVINELFAFGGWIYMQGMPGTNGPNKYDRHDSTHKKTKGRFSTAFLRNFNTPLVVFTCSAGVFFIANGIQIGFHNIFGQVCRTIRLGPCIRAEWIAIGTVFLLGSYFVYRSKK